MEPVSLTNGPCLESCQNARAYRASYAAKAYLVTFTSALARELAGTGVRVQVCCPGPVAAEFPHDTGIDPTRLPVPPMDPGDVVTDSLAALGLGQTVHIPGLGDQPPSSSSTMPPASSCKPAGRH